MEQDFSKNKKQTESIKMNTNNNSTHLEYLEVKRLLTQLSTMLTMIIPTKVSISYLAESTCKSRQIIRQYLQIIFNLKKIFGRKVVKLLLVKK